MSRVAAEHEAAGQSHLPLFEGEFVHADRITKFSLLSKKVRVQTCTK